MKMGQMARPLLPKALRNKVPAKQHAGTWPRTQHARKMLLLDGCVQPSMAPNINAATARVLDDAAGTNGFLSTMGKRVEERLADLQRLQAEYVNYRRRVDRDRDVARDTAVNGVLEALLPVRDFKPRHASTLLTFDAVVDAIDKVEAGRKAAEAPTG